MTSFFNKDKVYPEVWCSGLIKPTIYKKGDRKILATAEETFSHGQIILIIDDRLSCTLADLSMPNKMRPSFISEWTCWRTTDAIFILYTSMQSLKKKKKPVCQGFWLSQSFSLMEVTVLSWLEQEHNVYFKATVRVTTNNKLYLIPSNIARGKEGCNLNPLLFHLYISDLESHLITNRYLQMI